MTRCSLILLVGENLKPVSVGICDKIDAHCRIFEADTAHLLVQPVRGFVVVRTERKMEFTLAEVIGLGMIAQPCELQLEPAVRRCKIDEDEGAVGCGFAAYFPEAERFVVECDGGVEIGDIVVLVDHGKSHGNSPFVGALVKRGYLKTVYHIEAVVYKHK